MNVFSDLLRQAAQEVRDYEPTAPFLSTEWLESLAQQMEAASMLEEDDDVENAIGTLAHLIIDSVPLTRPFAPSFGRVLDAVQRRRKKRGKRR